MHQADPRIGRARAIAQRDAVLARVRRARRLAVVAAAGLTAGFAALVSVLAPGRTISTAQAKATVGSGSREGLPPAASAGALGLQSPSAAPSSASPSPPASIPAPTVAVQSSSPVVSGGS